MKTIERYIILKLLRSFLLVMFLLAGLFSLTALLDEVSDIGTGRYMWSDALLYVCQSAPHRILDLIPLTGLLGGIIGLGGLSASNELVALRAMGVSAWRLALTAIKAGVLLVLGSLVLAQFVAPPIQSSADTQRSVAIHDSDALRLDSGFWFRDGTRLVEVARVLPGNRLEDIVTYEFDDEGRLLERTRAREAQVVDSQNWILKGVKQDIMRGDRFEVVRKKSLPWSSSFDNSFVELTLLRPESLSITALIQYVNSMREWGQVDEAYRLQLWRLLGLPLSTLAMLLLGIPFVLTHGRSSSGRRLAVGGLLGTLGYALDRIGGYLGMLGGVDAVLTALLPGVLILSIAVVLMRRAR
jgi:lipopolysaccharide export system permease protein